MTPDELDAMRHDLHDEDCPTLADYRKRLLAEVDRLTTDAEESDQVRSMMAGLLRDTANGLKGDPGPMASHDWSDLPRIAAQVGELARLHCEFYTAEDEDCFHRKLGRPIAAYPCFPCRLRQAML